jgi:hypothetical protein
MTKFIAILSIISILMVGSVALAHHPGHMGKCQKSPSCFSSPQVVVEWYARMTYPLPMPPPCPIPYYHYYWWPGHYWGWNWLPFNVWP